MAFVLKLYDGTNTADFMKEDYLLANGGLSIPPPTKKQIWGGTSINAQGSYLVATSWENRAIKIKFQITGTTRDELANRATAIERFLKTARSRSITKSGPKVELQYQWDGATNKSYFEVIDGTLKWPEDTMSVEQVHQRTASTRYVIYDFELELTCSPFAQKISIVNPTRTPMPLTNGNGTDVTSGLVIYNHDDSTSGHDNWVEIDAADIDGEEFTKTIIRLVGNSGESEKIGKIYIGARIGSVLFKHVLEAEDYEYRIGSNSPTLDADYSSGGYWLALPYTGNTEQTLIRWGLTAGETLATKGPFRFFGRCKDGSHWPTTANFRIRVLYGTESLYESEWRKPINSLTELLDFGTIYMPPWLIGDFASMQSLKIEIQAKGDAVATSFTLDLDYLTLLPQDGGYRTLHYRVSGLGQLDHILDDGLDETVHHESLSGDVVGITFGLMPRLVLTPGTKTRLYFILEGTSGNCEIARSVKVYVYPFPQFNAVA